MQLSPWIGWGFTVPDCFLLDFQGGSKIGSRVVTQRVSSGFLTGFQRSFLRPNGGSTNLECSKISSPRPWEVLILLSPPAMKLHEYVAACVELSKAKFSADAGDEEGGGRVAFGI